MNEIDCLTWNVHRCRGNDGLVDPVRIADALVGLTDAVPPDVVVLTEADGEARPHAGLLDLERIETGTGLRSAHSDRALRWGDDSHGFLGTLVLHSPRLRPVSGHLLDLPGRYPRGAAVVTFEGPAGRFRVVGTHLSLSQALRAVQMRAIGQYLDRNTEMPTLIVGDLNEWRPWGGAAFSRRLVGRAFSGPAPLTFPTWRPVFPLDRVLAAAPARVLSAEAVTGAALRAASDHFPLRARVALG